MIFAVDIINRRGPSNEIRRQLQPKKTKVTLYYCLYSSKICFTHPSLLRNKTKHFSFKSRCVIRVKNNEMRRPL